MHTSRVSIALLILPYTLSCLVAAAEPESWADPALPVTEGLALWLDPSAENRARKANGFRPLAEADGVDRLHDASGNGRHVRQETSADRPRFRLDGQRGFLQFDGQRSHLACADQKLRFGELTLFVVAAPHDNPGSFSALLAMNADGGNDYVTGLNLDQGPWPSEQFEVLSAEGAGFGGVHNLKNGRTPFSKLHRICLVAASGEGATRLLLNGTAAGRRDRQSKEIQMDRFTLGARFYAHGQPPQTTGFFHGEIAEALLYERRLSDEEIAAVDRYLAEKFGDLRDVPLPPQVAGAKPLVRVENPPPVQVLVPGFVVRQLPVDLPNVNNVLYREDGALVAHCYDGNIHLLTDNDGDGLEETHRLYWENKGKIRDSIGMALLPPGDKRGRGVLITSRSKVLLLVDSDGDDAADQEIVVAEGWPETKQGIDACGVAVDPKNGRIYFGLGCADYTNGHQVGADGQARYDINSERGTIMRVSPDFQRRKSICTGVRFPGAIRFNAAGDLFCTDQEGATWLPNGNPFDELLHIRRGRHYGFPPRHPRHLPDVFDEPSVFDYRPQHQSTCGLNFNEPVNDGPVFGPASWQSDALVAGYSRGKLYRTRLVKTAHFGEQFKNAADYVAQNHLLASLNMLTVDACVSPHGELVVAAHSGGPDWGSGPTGRGKLYKIIYADRQAPQPAAIWAQSPREVRIAFDRPLDAEMLTDLARRTEIDAGEFVAAGDRFESLRPGYAVVANQLRSPRRDVPVLGVQVTPDRRTLIFTTAAHDAAVNYAVAMTGFRQGSSSASADDRDLPQFPDVDLQYDLCGVEATWKSADGARSWHGWLPHVDLDVARRFTEGSAAHDELWPLLAQPGELTLKTQLDLKDLLHPSVQPGSKLDYEPASDTVFVDCRRTPGFGGGAFSVTLDGKEAQRGGGNGGANDHFNWRHTIEVDAALPLAELAVVTETGSRDAAPSLELRFSHNLDSHHRPFPLRRLLLPWARQSLEPTPALDNRDLPELAGGNWLRGRRVFLSEEASCAKCHRAHGAGGAIGPDLSNLVHRDYASVLRDIVQPSYAINPDYLTHVMALVDGRVLTGAIRTQDDRLIVGDQEGRETVVARSDVAELQPSPLSIMPQDLDKKLGPEKLRDLLTFLLTEPPRMPDYGPAAPPPPRSASEVEQALAGAPEESLASNESSTKQVHIVLVAGEKDHGPGEHDYPAWRQAWQRLLSLAPHTQVTTADDWPSGQQLDQADVLVFYQRGDWNAERARDIDRFLSRGGGLVYIHWAVDGRMEAAGFAERIGLAWGAGSKYRHGDLPLQFAQPAEHPIARNFDKLRLHDESYWNGVGDRARIKVLATGVEEGQPQPLFWTREHLEGRIFVSIPGHFAWTFDDPLYRLLLLRAIAWTAGEPVDRFNELVWPGARLE